MSIKVRCYGDASVFYAIFEIFATSNPNRIVPRKFLYLK